MTRPLIAVAALFFAGCAEAAPPAPPAPQDTPPLARTPDAPCSGNVLRNPLFGIADPARPTDLEAPVTRPSDAGAGPEALWAWRAASDAMPRWTRHQTAAEGPLYLRAGEGVTQSGLKLAAGRWRLTIWASGAPNGPAGLSGEVGGGDSLVFEIPALGPPTVTAVDVDVQGTADQLTLTGLGPGETRLMQACLRPIG